MSTSDPAQQHFLRLPAERQQQVVRRLHARGYAPDEIARMSGLDRADVERLLGAATALVQR